MIHPSITAWRVDFNLALSSFKPLIAGVRNLVDWALQSPLLQAPKILFTSSIATVSGKLSNDYVTRLRPKFD